MPLTRSPCATHVKLSTVVKRAPDCIKAAWGGMFQLLNTLFNNCWDLRQELRLGLKRKHPCTWLGSLDSVHKTWSRRKMLVLKAISLQSWTKIVGTLILNCCCCCCYDLFVCCCCCCCCFFFIIIIIIQLPSLPPHLSMYVVFLWTLIQGSGECQVS